MKIPFYFTLVLILSLIVTSCSSDDDGVVTNPDAQDTETTNLFNINGSDYAVKTVFYSREFNSFTSLWQYTLFLFSSETEIVGGEIIFQDSSTSGIALTITSPSSNLQVQDYPISIGDDDPDTFRGIYLINQNLNSSDIDIDEVGIPIDSGLLKVLQVNDNAIELDFSGTDIFETPVTSYFEGNFINFD